MVECARCGLQMQWMECHSLNNYYGVYGDFCDECEPFVRHDENGVPEHPGEVLLLMIKQDAETLEQAFLHNRHHELKP